MSIAPTPHDTIFRDGTASLLHFRSTQATPGRPVLLVPSMINRWYVMDLHEKASVANSFVEAGFDTYLLDWGVPRDEDRYITWDDVISRLHRFVKRVVRVTGEDKIGVLAYCMGATVSGIYTALHPEHVATFVNLAGPFDFSEAGRLGTMTDPEWFDATAIAAAGNVAPSQMQGGFILLRPTSEIGKWVTWLDKLHKPEAKAAFEALNTWASDNIPFPAAAYETYITELYQANNLVQGKHYVHGRRVDLANITCPVMTIATSRDHICPPHAAKGLHDNVGSKIKEMVIVKGGHVGAVVGSRASKDLYPQMTAWFDKYLAPRGAAPRVRVVNEPPTEAATPKTAVVTPKPDAPTVEDGPAVTEDKTQTVDAAAAATAPKTTKTRRTTRGAKK